VPELPEIEVARRDLAPQLANLAISGVVVREPRLRWRISREVGELAGRIVRAVRRRGKYLVLDCGDGCLILHLGMSGSLRLVPPGTPAQKHDHFDLLLGNRVLRLRDPRRFGSVLWVRGTESQHPLLARVGIEPLAAEFDADRLHALTRGRRAPIKQFLMDGRHIAGIGNIYANESLFGAGIRPTRRARALSVAACADLVRAIKQTLLAAIRAGGSSLRDYVRSDGQPGRFQNRCWVYDRAGSPCRRCGTRIRRLIQGQRATYYCPSCQR
jgi:formamidopyrimidine-DNA glycosylase